MPIYTEEERCNVRRICENEIDRIREARTAEQIDEKGCLALGHIQAFYAMEALRVADHCQLIKDLAATEVECLTALSAPKY